MLPARRPLNNQPPPWTSPRREKQSCFIWRLPARGVARLGTAAVFFDAPRGLVNHPPHYFRCKKQSPVYNMDMATPSTPNRRELKFTTLDQVVADVRTLEAAEQAGKLKCNGNWTFGQILGHLSGWVDYSFDGVPMKVPFFVKWIMKPMKKKFLTQPMRPGSRIPRQPGGTLSMQVISSAEGLTRFYKSFDRLSKGSPAIPHLLFGPMTHQEWIAQHLRHSELHLSFLNASD